MQQNQVIARLRFSIRIIISRLISRATIAEFLKGGAACGLWLQTIREAPNHALSDRITTLLGTRRLTGLGGVPTASSPHEAAAYESDRS